MTAIFLISLAVGGIGGALTGVVVHLLTRPRRPL